MKKGFFENSENNKSMMRLLAFIVVVTGCTAFIAEVIFSMFKTFDHHLIEISAFVALGLTAKWAQNKDEKQTKQ